MLLERSTVNGGANGDSVDDDGDEAGIILLRCESLQKSNRIDANSRLANFLMCIYIHEAFNR